MCPIIYLQGQDSEKCQFKMHVLRLLARKRYLTYLLCFLAALYLFFAFQRFLRFTFRGRHLTVHPVGFGIFRIYYDELLPSVSSLPDKHPVSTVTLLFTKSMSTYSWEEVGTPEVLHKAGYRVLCIHLPVFQQNAKEPTFPVQGEILADALQQLNALDCILVAPSKTGSFALPVVLRGGYHLSGFVAISPSDTQQFTSKEYMLVTVPTLVLVGANDETSSVALQNLQQFPNKRIVELRNAGHDCYVDQTTMFHRVLLEFLQSIPTQTHKPVHSQ